MQTIRKTSSGRRVKPNLESYEHDCASFSWTQARGWLSGLPQGGGLNIAYEAVDRHARGPLGQKAAVRWVDRESRVREFSYKDLSGLSSRFASVLKALGVAKGDSVFSLLGRVPELYVMALGTWKNQSVFCPLFPAFGPEPIQSRMTIGRAKVLVTTEALYQKKVAQWRRALPDLEHVLLIRIDSAAIPAGTADFQALLNSAPDNFVTAATDPEDSALLHFTSGTTGMPKGAVHSHAAVVGHYASAYFALDLHSEDVFWCTADPGWVTGTCYGIIAPLAIGATVVVDEGEFDAARWYRILSEQGVSVWYTAPTAVRMLMKAGEPAEYRHAFPKLRFMASVGEPLDAAAVCWGEKAFGRPFHDNWWQTETGGIMIANYEAMDIKPGSMGRPLPGIEAAIVQRDGEGGLRVVDDPDTVGELALRVGWPSMFRSYLGQDERYGRCFVDGWYLSGDLARRDGDGYYWFVGRSDDVIKSAGHLIGPFEVESVFMEHPAVAEAGVIGKPDPLVGEVVKVFLVLKAGFTADDGMRRELMAHGRIRLGPVVAPKEIAFCDDLPKTRSGKIMRRLLKARELGLPEGDLSTLLGRP